MLDNNKHWARLALRLFSHELKRGDLNIIAAAIALAVLTVFSLASVTDRIATLINEKSTAFIAADRVLDSRHDIPAEFQQEAEKIHNLRTARQTFFDTMLFSGDEMQLASVKAVSANYPLRGDLKIADKLDGEAYITNTIPARGEVWMSESVIYSLDLELGQSVELGAASFILSHVLVEEPDAPMSFFSASRRVLINVDDVEKTQVIQPGSRVYRRLLFAGEKSDLSNYYEWLKPQMQENQSWYGIKDRRSPVTDSLNRAESYLLLAGLLGIMLASVAIAVSARRYCQRQYDPVALMKTLGGSRKTIRQVYLTHLLLVTSLATFVGLGLGYILQALASDYMANGLEVNLPPAGYSPWFTSIATGLICAVMFTLKPLLDLFDIPPLRVLRRQLGDTLAISRIHLTLSALTLYALMLIFSWQFKLASILFLSSIILVAVLFGLSRLLFKGGRKLGLRPSSSTSLALASLQKRANANAVQLVSFALAIKLLLFLFILKNDLINDWQTQLPENAPNSFLVNISEYEKPEIASSLQEIGAETSAFYPIILGRVNKINGEEVQREVSKDENEKQDEEARAGVGRELNMTWTTALPESNQVTEGQWFSQNSKSEVSVEEKFAKRLGLELGDSIELLIGEQRVEVTISSLRSLDWNSMKPNFFLILSPDVLSDLPATYIASVFVHPDKKRQFNQIIRDFPTVSVIDVAALLKQLKSTIDQVSLAIGFVLIIVMISGALVLISQVQSSMQERLQEVVILRTLGARARLIQNATLFEFALLGMLAGFVASLASDGVLFIVQQQAFNLPGKLHPHIWVLGPLSGAAFVALLGYGMAFKAMRSNTATMLRKLI